MDQNTEIERFCRDVAAMEALREELTKIGTDTAAIVQFANSKGYSFTLADVQDLAAQAALTEDQLDAVAGGELIPVDGRLNGTTGLASFSPLTSPFLGTLSASGNEVMIVRPRLR